MKERSQIQNRAEYLDTMIQDFTVKSQEAFKDREMLGDLWTIERSLDERKIQL